ncbi:MAG: DUF4258 domain-containing protein [Candidatus Brocadiaceae bacterium]|nr:DUF4258 domain-containing protein [Candidatus Brocadiaceae bacterium]
MKRVEIIPIAERKLKRRGISKEWIEDTLLNPSQVVAGYGGRKIAQKKFLISAKEYLLRIVYEDTEEKYIIVTTYLTSQVGRYWKEEK